jgi:hypothetical protein
MKSGNNAGIAVFDHRDPILKGINCISTYVQYNSFLNHSHYFWDKRRITRHVSALCKNAEIQQMVMWSYYCTVRSEEVELLRSA